MFVLLINTCTICFYIGRKFWKIMIIFGVLLHFRAHFWSISDSQFWWFFLPSGKFFHHFRAPGAPRASRCCSNEKFGPLHKCHFFIIFWPGLPNTLFRLQAHDLDLSFCKNLEKYIVSWSKLVLVTLNGQKCEKYQK